MKGYTTKQEIENYLLITIDSSFWTQITNWIEDIETYIDKMTGRNFVADTQASAKYYDGDNTGKLLIDDAVAITEIIIGSGPALVADSDPLLADGDFILYPANRLPLNKIELRAGYFPLYPKRCVRVKGKWGYSTAVPKDIRQVATVLVAGIINYSLNAEGEVKSMSIGRYNVTYRDEKNWQDFERVSDVLNYYKRFIIR